MQKVKSPWQHQNEGSLAQREDSPPDHSQLGNWSSFTNNAEKWKMA